MLSGASIPAETSEAGIIQPGITLTVESSEITESDIFNGDIPPATDSNVRSEDTLFSPMDSLVASDGSKLESTEKMLPDLRKAMVGNPLLRKFSRSSNVTVAQWRERDAQVW